MIRHGDFWGAFADGMILFPLIALLAAQGGYSAPLLLATAGLMYLFAGIVFRIPMPVQPLKAIAIAAISLGASGTEIRVAGMCLGLTCLLLSVPIVEKYAERIPDSLIHALQLGIGILLVKQGIKAGTLAHFSTLTSLVSFFSVFALCLFSFFSSTIPVLGILATLGLAWGVIFPSTLHHASVTPPAFFRPALVLSLFLPQLALTFFNSVLATKKVAEQYFGSAASRVTVSRLLRSIGLGNCFMALISGLPFCHGSGGLTAHYRGGARSWHSNIVIGLACLAFALFFRNFQYPPFVLTLLLSTIGLLHIHLAKPTFEHTLGKWELLLSAFVVIATSNLLIVIALVAGMEVIARLPTLHKEAEFA